jgi:hypothetical protein
MKETIVLGNVAMQPSKKAARSNIAHNFFLYAHTFSCCSIEEQDKWVRNAIDQYCLLCTVVE